MRLRDLFLHDPIGGALPVYDVDPGHRPMVVSSTGCSVVPCVGKTVTVPMLPAGEVDAERAVAALLLKASEADESCVDSVENAVGDSEAFFRLADLDMGAMASGGAVPSSTSVDEDGGMYYDGCPVVVSDLIPRDVLIVLAHPEYLGRVVTRKEEIGFLLHGRRGVHRFMVAGRRRQPPA